jgi:hypothetical protein
LEELEAQLFSHVQEPDSYWMPLARKEYSELSYSLVEDMYISHGFNNETDLLENILSLVHEQASFLMSVKCGIHKSNDSSCLLK